MQRSGSFSSVGSGASGTSGVSGVSSAAGSTASRGGGKDGMGGESANDLLEQNQTFQAGIFGVLYTLAKEKYDSSKRFVVAKLVLDFLQCFILVAQPSYGWTIDEDMWFWKIISWVIFANPIVSKGYTFYIAILYTLAVCIVISLLLCIWVGWCFKNDRFPYVWPIKMLRIVIAAFVSVFYVGSLAIFMVALNCQWFVSGDGQFKLHSFPDKECLAMPHIVHMIVAGICAIIFCAISYAMSIADFEMSPISKRYLGSPNTRVEQRTFWVRTIMTVTVAILYGKLKIQAIILACSSGFVFWSYVRWQPHFVPLINHIRAGLWCMVFWGGAVLMALAFGEHHGEEWYNEQCTNVMVIGLLPMLVAGTLISWGRLRWRMSHALQRFRTMSPASVTRLRDVYRFKDPYEVEIVARCCRRYLPEDDEVLDPDAVKLAEWVIKVGLAFFHDQVFMVITHSNFLIEVQNNYQSGTTQLQQAKKLNPGISDKFAIFVREQEHKQKAQSQSSGESAVDLVSYVEFQRNYRLLVKTHKQALTATKNFWKLLLHHDVSFKLLAKSFRIIDESKTKADKTFKMVLDRYPSSVKLLRSYGRFLEEVKNDPWTAAKYLAEADKLEEQQETTNADALLGGGNEGPQMGMDGENKQSTMLASVDEKNNAVAVINATGIIQMANKVLLKQFGYKKGELEGKNISMLMPAPFNQRHNGYLRNYLTTGKAKILDSVRDVVGLHKDRFVFPIKIAVTRVSGTGADSMFMGVLKPADDDPKCVRAWVMPQGSILCVDQRFSDWFGKGPAEVVGRSMSTLATEQDTLMKLLDQAQSATERDFTSGKVKAANVHVLHKYADAQQCDLNVELGGTDSQRLLVLNIRRSGPGADDQNNMMVTDAKGRIMYMNSDLQSMLGYTAKEVQRMDMSHLMSVPYSMLHHRWMKDPSARVPPQSCRNSATVVMLDCKSTPVPVRPHIQTREDGDSVIHVVNVEKSSWERGLDERRLALVIDPKGLVQQVGESPMSLFGFKPQLLVHQALSSFVDVFQALSGEVEELVAKMVAKASEKPGYSWRVGVHPPTDENHERADSAVAKAVLLKNTKPALMQIQLIEPEQEGDLPIIKLFLWKADMVTGVVEMDHGCIVQKPACCPLHPSGMLFGCADKVLMKQHLHRYMDLPGKHAEALLADNKVKGAMKTGTTGRKIGPLRTITAFHADGRPTQLKAVAVAKENHRVVVKLNFVNLYRGDPAAFKATLATTEGGNRHSVLMLEQSDQRVAEISKLNKQPSVAPRGGVKFAGHDDGDGRDSPALAEQLRQQQSQGAGDSDSGSDDGGGEPAAAGDAAIDRDGNDDAQSGISSALDGASEAGGSEAAYAAYTADFKRGKRYKKLTKLLATNKAKADLNRYTWHTYMILGMLLLVHITFFIVLVLELNEKMSYVKEVDGCGQVSYYMQRLQVMARALDNLYKNQTNDGWYSWGTTAINTTASAGHRRLQQTSNLTTPFQFSTDPNIIGSGNGLPSPVDGVKGMSIKELLVKMREYTDKMEELHQGLYLGFTKLRSLGAAYELDVIWEGKSINETVYIDTRVATFTDNTNSLWLMGNQFIASCRELFSNHALLYNTTGGDLQKSRDWQYVIRNGPLYITAGYRHSIDAFVLRCWDGVNQVIKLGIVLLVIEGGFVCVVAIVWSWLLLQACARQRYSLFSVFLAVPTAFLRALASKSVKVDAEGDDDDDDDDEDMRKKAADQTQQQDESAAAAAIVQAANVTKARRASIDSLPAGPKGGKVVVVDVDLPAVRQPWHTRLVKALHLSAFTGGTAVGLDTGKKRLIRNNTDPVLLTVPFVIWTICVVIVYTYSFIALNTVLDPLISNEVANRVLVRLMRTFHGAHELISAPPWNETVHPVYEDSPTHTLQQYLLLREADVHSMYDALLYGSTELSKELAFETVSGTLFVGSQPADFFFRKTDDCYLKGDDQRWCFKEGYPYYHVNAHALDPMMRRFFEELTLLGHDAGNDTARLGFNSTRFDYIFRVVGGQLTSGLQAAGTYYTNAVISRMNNVLIAHIVLFVMCFVLLIIYFFFQFRPFLRRMHAESRQVAELLSQLPGELDVEGLVAQAILRNKGNDDDDDDDAAAFGATNRRSMDLRRQSLGDRPSANGRNSAVGRGSGNLSAGAPKKGKEDDASSVASSGE